MFFMHDAIPPKRILKVPIVKIYIDCDGVLADFDGWKAEIAKTRPEVNDDTKGLWSVVKDEDHFYLNLPMLPDAQELMSFLRETEIPLAILTALPRRNTVPDAESDKRTWIKKYIDPSIEFNIGPFAIDKQNFAKPGRVLIDDNDKNIAQWNAKGGIGILHRTLQATLEELVKVLEEQEEA
jgi:5'(3')-deoxyribonucleotidase